MFERVLCFQHLSRCYCGVGLPSGKFAPHWCAFLRSEFQVGKKLLNVGCRCLVERSRSGANAKGVQTLFHMKCGTKQGKGVTKVETQSSGQGPFIAQLKVSKASFCPFDKIRPYHVLVIPCLSSKRA